MSDFGWNPETVTAIAIAGAALSLLPAALAARAALRTFELESSPYIIICDGKQLLSKAPAEKQLHEYDYELRACEPIGDDIAFGTKEMMSASERLPAGTPGKIAPRPEPSAASFGKPTPMAIIGIRNVGRSPAVRLWLSGRITRRHNGALERPMDIIIVIDALPPGDAIVRVTNYTGFTLVIGIVRASQDDDEREVGKRVDSRKRQKHLRLASLQLFSVAPNSEIKTAR